MAQQIKITQTSNADMNIGVPKTQTAIDWLVEQVNSDCLNSTFIKHELVNQAKQMEKEQIEKAIDDALNAYGIIK